ncbi:HAD family hydrolase [Catellatospora methionotrophica]|uniref:HAD family hydrolase n=1 Tax=Catellatospora methionotrophica TaxID=121620 RepID=UPI00340C8C22
MAFLPSWRPGAARDAITSFLDESLALPPDQRVAVLDNDGTLWCEKPNYTQYDFLVRTLHAAAEQDGGLGDRPEYRALLDGDRAALGELGLQRIAMALLELCEGWTPDDFADRVRDFMASEKHPGRGAPYPKMVYQPMLELLEALRGHGFDVFIVTGGGTEFVRAVSRDLYGVRPDDVVGTLVEYHYEAREAGPALVRTAFAHGEVNEGPAKVEHIQTQLGRRPIFAAGNSAGDREMLEYARTAGTPSLALLVDHDDAEREYAYASAAVTMKDTEPITAVAGRLGWTVVSMRDDWSVVFPA